MLLCYCKVRNKGLEQVMKRHYYAEYSPYGIDTVSDIDKCYVFESRDERDCWVDRQNTDYDNYAQAITAKYARAIYNLSGLEFDGGFYRKDCY